MVNLDWCKKQARGISSINEKEHLSESYLREAYDSFEAYLKNKGKWKVITGYYSCYDALYAILMKCGIKSEIHDCTIKLMGFFDFSNEEIKFMEDFKVKRIDVQYYLKDILFEEDLKIKAFILKCELILDKLNEDKVKKIRSKFKEFIKKK